MKIELLVKDVKGIFEVAERFASSTNIDNYYNYAYIEINDKNSRVTTSNGDNSFSAPFSIDNGNNTSSHIEKDNFLLPIGHFMRLLKDLPQDNFILDIDKNSIKMKGKNFKYSLPVKIDKDFTFFTPIGEVLNSIKLKSKDFAKSIEKVIFCAAKDVKELKDIFLKSIYININNDVIDVIATDRHRMAYKINNIEKFNNNKDDANTNILLPLDFVQNMLPLLKSYEGNIEIRVYDNVINIIFNNGYNLYSRKIEVEKIIKLNTMISFDMNSVEININKKELSGALKRVAGLSEMKIVDLKFEKSKLIIHGRGADLGEGEEILDIINKNDFVKNVTINAFFIIDTLSQMDSDEVQIRLNEIDKKPIAIKEFGGDDNYIVSLMPTRI
jgi:DNA polymerase III sliding clamp (beta) subunit (PCNA family)